MAIPQGTIGVGYSTLPGQVGQIESLSAPGGVGLALGWDGLLLESQTWSGPVAGSVSFDYADYGLQLVTEWVNGVHEVDLVYDDDGLLIQAGELTMPRNPSHGLVDSTDLGAVSTQYLYNAFGELDEDVALLDGMPATTLYRNQYTQRDKLGRILQKLETIGGTSATWEYAYDAAGRLDTIRKDGVPQADYAYDLNGNRLCTNETAGSCPASAVYDEQDRLVSDEAGRTYTYSEAGELETVTEGGQQTSYRYDPLGSLRTVCLLGTDPQDCTNTGGTEIEYLVDALGQRIGKRVNGTLQKGFLWSDGLRVAAELDGSGAVVSRFVYAGRPNVPEYMVKVGQTYRIVTDHLGSVRLVVNAATGAVAQRIDYDAWGIPTFVSGPADFQPFGFAGGFYDPDTGLVRFGARDYDARSGRWTSRDPVLFRGHDANLLAYAANDPINALDPTGTLWVLGGSGVNGGGIVGKGGSGGTYFNPGTGEYGSYSSSSLGVTSPGGTLEHEYGIGAGNDPSGTTTSATVGGSLGIVSCSVSVGWSNSGPSFRFGFGATWPPSLSASAEQTETTVSTTGNAYREAEEAILGRYPPPLFPPGM